MSRTSFPWGCLFIKATSRIPPGLRRLRSAHLRVTWPARPETTPAPREPPCLHLWIIPPLLCCRLCVYLRLTNITASALFISRKKRQSALLMMRLFCCFFFCCRRRCCCFKSVLLALPARPLVPRSYFDCLRQTKKQKQKQKNRRSVPVRRMYVGDKKAAGVQKEKRRGGKK